MYETTQLIHASIFISEFGGLKYYFSKFSFLGGKSAPTNVNLEGKNLKHKQNKNKPRKLKQDL